MEPQISCCSSKKVLESARSYRRLFSSGVKKGEVGTESCEKKSEKAECECQWGDAKPRASRKRKQFWLYGENKENKVSENSKTTEELNHVNKFKSAIPDWQGLVEKVKKRRLRDLEEKLRKRELQKQNLAKQLLDLEEGEIPPSGSPSPENDFFSTSDKSDLVEEMNGEMTKRQTVFDILKDLEEGEIPTRSRSSSHSQYTKDSFRRVSEEAKISMNSQSEGILDNLVDMEDREMPGKQTVKPVVMVDDHKCQTEIPQKILGTSQLRSMDKEQQKAENEIVRLGKKTERPITMADDCNFQTGIPQKSNKTSKLMPCSSDSEIKADKIQRTSKAAQAGSGSPIVPAHVSDVLLNRKELPTSPVGTVIVVDSDTDSDVVELTDQKSVTSISNVKNNEVSSSFNGLKDGVTRSNSVEKPSPEDPQSTLDEVAMADPAAECSAETIPACNSYSPGLEDCASRSTSFEKHSIDENKDKVDSIAEPSENLQSSSHEVILVDRPAECSVHALPIQEQSAPIKAANRPESQDRGAAAPVCSESHLSSASSSLRSGSLQCPQNAGRHTSSPEVQASIPPFSEEAVQLSTPSVVDLQQPQLRNVQTNGNATHFHEPGSRTNAPDIRSMAASLASMNANLQLPRRSQLPCYDPLQTELDRLQKHYDQELKMHEAMMLNMRHKRDEAIEEIKKKYEVFFQDANAAMQHKTTDYKAKFLRVYLNNLLANTWMFPEKEYQEASTSDTRQAAPDVINMVRHPTLQMPAVRLDQQHPPVTVPFRPVMINQPSPVPTRPFSGHIVPQNGHQFRVAAPHLRAPRPPTMHCPLPSANCPELIQQMQISSHNH